MWFLHGLLNRWSASRWQTLKIQALWPIYEIDFSVGERPVSIVGQCTPAILQQAALRGSSVPYCDGDIVEVVITQQQIAASLAEEESG